jgi:cytoskeleton protein RodZ
MSEIETPVSNEKDVLHSDDPVEITAGDLLKKAREAAGLHIAALAVLLKVPVKKLEALEANRLDLLHDPVFIRALASSVCRTLKMDASPVLARLPQTHAPKLTYQGVGINAPFRSPSDGPGPSIWDQMSRPAVLIGLALLIGALGMVFLPAIKMGINAVNSEVMDSRATSVVTAGGTSNAEKIDLEKPVMTAVQTNTPLVAAAPVTSMDAAQPEQKVSGLNSSVTAPSPSYSLKIADAVVASSPAQFTPSQTLTAGIATSTRTSLVTPKPLPGTDLIVFTANGPSWVEATDAKGQVVLRRVLNAGDAAGASGALPLKVVIGRANDTQVKIRGKAFDLNAVSKDNVARFEVR